MQGVLILSVSELWSLPRLIDIADTLAPEIQQGVGKCPRVETGDEFLGHWFNLGNQSVVGNL